MQKKRTRRSPLAQLVLKLDREPPLLCSAGAAHGRPCQVGQAWIEFSKKKKIFKKKKKIVRPQLTSIYCLSPFVPTNIFWI
jgi:hypothetical protein